MRLTLKIVEQLLTKTPDIWSLNSRSRAASIIARDGNVCVELRVKRTPPELVSEICEEKKEQAELIFWFGPEAVQMKLPRRIHARAVELWQSIAMTSEEIESAKRSFRST